MIDLNRWTKFELNCQDDPKTVFEEAFCKEFFALQQGIDLSDVKIIKGARGIENEPINGISFQSKYFISWNWSKIKESLEKVLKYHSEYFPDLKKVIVYVKEIGSDSYLKEKFNGGILEQLSNIGVDVVFFENFDIVDIDEKYSEMRHYFRLTEDNSLFLKLSDKYIQNLFLEEAKSILDILGEENKFLNLDENQKYEYHRLLGNYKFQYNTLVDQDKYKDWYKEYIEAYRYNKTDKGKNTYAVALIEEKKYDEAENLLNSIFSDENYSEKVYHNILRVKNLKGLGLDKIKEILDSRYSNDSLILSLLGSIAYEEKNFQEAMKYFNQYIKKDDINFRGKINYLLITQSYLLEEFDIHNLNIEGKEKYLNYLNVYLDDKNHFDSRKINVFGGIYNVIALINYLILGDRDEAINYFKKSIEILDDPVVIFNYSKLLDEFGDKKDLVISNLEGIISNLDKYAGNATVEQTIIFLAHVYTSNDEFEKGIEILNKGLRDYKDNLSENTIESIYLTKIDLLKKVNYDEASELLKNILKKYSNNIRYNFYGYYFFNDINLLKKAYQLYSDSDKILSSSYTLELADQLGRNKLNEESFEVFKSELKDFSKETYVESFIHSAINTGKISEVEDIIKTYIASIGGNDNHLSVLYKAYIEYLSQNYSEAVNIINGFGEYESFHGLLLLKADLKLRLGDFDGLKDCIEVINSKHDYKTFSFHDKEKYINYLVLTSPLDAIKKNYRLISIENNPNNKERFVGINFGLFLGVDLSGLDSEEINNDSYIVIKNTNSDKKLNIILDDYSTKDIIRCDYIFKPGSREYELLMGKKKGEVISNLFQNSIGLDNDQYEIIIISNKYVELHKQYYENPETLTFLKAFQFNEDTFIDQLKEISMQNSEDKKNKIETLKELQKKGSLPFAMFCKFINISYIEGYNLYTHNKDFNFISDTIYKYDNVEIKGIILDVVSLQTLLEMEIGELIAHKNKIHIAQSTRDHFLFEKLQLESSPHMRTAGYVNFDDKGNLYYTDVEENNREKQIAYLDKIIKFIDDNCSILSSRSLIAENEITEAVGKEFYDTIMMAEENNLLYLTDDLTVRRFFRSKSVNCLSMESLILLYRHLGYLVDDELYKYLHKLIEFNYTNISESVLKFLLKYTLINEKNSELNILLKYDYNIEYIAQEVIVYIDILIKQGNDIKDRFKDIMKVIYNSFDKKDFIESYVNICMGIKDETTKYRYIKLIDNI